MRNRFNFVTVCIGTDCKKLVVCNSWYSYSDSASSSSFCPYNSVGSTAGATVALLVDKMLLVNSSNCKKGSASCTYSVPLGLVLDNHMSSPSGRFILNSELSPLPVKSQEPEKNASSIGTIEWCMLLALHIPRDAETQDQNQAAALLLPQDTALHPGEGSLILTPQLDPLTEQQVLAVCNLQQSSQQAEDALSQGMEALQQSLADILAAGSLGAPNVANYMGQMAMAMGKLGTLENFVHQVIYRTFCCFQHHISMESVVTFV
eukprot:Gb_28831 [translate_table: standard]